MGVAYYGNCSQCGRTCSCLSAKDPDGLCPQCEDPTQPPDSTLNPDLTVLCLLGSVVTHVDEAISTTGHPFDVAALKSLLEDPALVEWMYQMDKMSLVPKKR